MYKFINNFTTTAEYLSVEEELDNPHVALTKDDMVVHYSPYDFSKHVPYVDLGLPSGTLWATMNVGASSETDYGNYYMYGKGARQYNSSDSIYTGTENPLDPSNDTAAVVWGGKWHMPTKTQMQELINNTTYQWTTINGVNGGKFTATNGNYVFFPAAGRWSNGSQNSVVNFGYCWGSSPDGSGSAYYLGFYNGSRSVYNSSREYGYPVRPVKDMFIKIEDANGHDYVEIGGIKWATMNVGASSITDKGLYFSYGDVYGYSEGERDFIWDDYKFTDRDDLEFNETVTMTKYNSIDGKTVLDLEDDAARVNMGGTWRMPTEEDFTTLLDAVNIEWTNDYQNSGISGIICTDKTDSSKVLFFPVGGSIFEGTEGRAYGPEGVYLTSNISSEFNDYSEEYGEPEYNHRYFYINYDPNIFGGRYMGSDVNDRGRFSQRYIGELVRGVLGSTLIPNK